MKMESHGGLTCGQEGFSEETFQQSTGRRKIAALEELLRQPAWRARPRDTGQPQVPTEWKEA